MNLILGIISLLIVFAGFIFGALRLFRRGKALYLRLLVCGTGCYALEELSALINYLTGGFEYIVTLGLLGLFGCLLFLLSANYGAIDIVVDDNTRNLKYRIIALSAPALMIVLIIHILFWVKDYGVWSPILIAIILLPSVFGSYFALKHVILPNDEFGILKASLWCNISALVFMVSEALSVLTVVSSGKMSANVFTVVSAIAVSAVSVFAVLGDKRWAI